jgi:hypothetical protein
MMQKDTRGFDAIQVVGRLLLVLLLACAPPLAISDGMPTPVKAGNDAAAITYEMPCHPAEAERAQKDACPHCTGEGTASQCQCCGYAVPAGMGFEARTLLDRHPDDAPPRMAVNDPLPESSGDRLYRPPIFHS